MGNSPHVVEGIGTAKFTIKEGSNLQTICLKNTLFVPTIHKNLISMARMDDAGMHAKLDKGFRIFSPNWKYLWSANRKDDFYVLRGTPIKNSNQNNSFVNERNRTKWDINLNTSHQAFSVENDIKLWHQRMGHCNYSILKTMFRNHLVKPDVELKGTEEKCEACIYGKNVRATYPKLEHIRSNEIL